MTRSDAKILLVLEDGLDAAPIEEALPAGTRVQSARLNGSRLPLKDASDADLMLVACASDGDHVLELIKAAHTQLQSRLPVVVIYAGSPNGFMERAFEAGADDLIALPQSQEHLAFALEKALVRKRGASSSQAGTMIAVLGPKGGTGKTLTTCNLAVALAATGASPVVVDLDLQFGDVGLALGLAPEKTMYDLAKSGGSIDMEKLETYLTPHVSGLRVLLAPTRPDQASFISTDLLRDVFALLRSNYDYVVVDTPPGFTPEVIASIDISTHIIIVGMLDSLSLKNTKLGLETLELMGYDNGRIKVLLNRSDSRIGISAEDVSMIVGRTPDVFVPSDREIAKSMTDGVPIVIAAERSEAARAFRTLADLYVDSVASQNGAGSSSNSKPEQGSQREPRKGMRQLLRRQ
jgi:pilus assembly protein CpaE